MQFEIEYYSGAGNLFTVLDNRTNLLEENELNNFAIIACEKSAKFTIKTEGLIVLGNPEKSLINSDKTYPFSVRFFNPDGSSGMMCGNGARCSVRYAQSLGMLNHLSSDSEIRFALAGDEYNALVLGDKIKVKFPPERFFQLNKEIPFDNELIFGDFVDVGSPHIIFDYEVVPYSENFSFRNYPINDFAIPIRNNSEIFPNGVNVSVFQIQEKNVVNLRTFERGVESETGACGTASVSTALILHKKNLVGNSIQIIPPSRSPLEVEILQVQKNSLTEIEGFNLTGFAEKIGKASINF